MRAAVVGDSLRVLLVDDNPDDRILAARQLQREFPGLEVRHVGDARAFEAAVQAGDFDAVITDYQLNWSSGLSVLDRVRQRSPCPVIMFTGTGTEEVAVTAMKQGLDDYVIKAPAHYQRLPGALRLAVERARQRESARVAERERRAAEAALRESEARFRALADNAPVGIFLTDAAGSNLYCNAAKRRLMGLEGGEALGHAWQELLHPEDRERVLADWRRAIEAGQVYDGSGRYLRRDGSEVWWHVVASGVEVDGRLRWTVGIAQDVTEKRRVEQELHRKEAQLAQLQRIEAVGRLAGGVAHDFNNLLNVVFGHCDLLLRELGEGSRPRQRVEQILRAAERGGALTRQLLAFSRQQVIQPRVLDLNEVVAETTELLRPLIGEDVELVLLRAPELSSVNADAGQLQQVLMNLALNARDAMPLGGKLTIETAEVEVSQAYAGAHPWVEPGRYVVLSVSDSGVGMDAETRARAFEPFFTTKPEGKGTGLGLATVYGIVKQSGGHISLYSEPRLGTTFKIYLPRVAAAPEPAAPRPLGSPRGNETVLLVEDEPLALEMLAEALASYGYSVLPAADGPAALELAARAEAPIQVLLTDVIMPGMSGRELAETLRPRHAGLRVLYMSGYTSEAITRHGVLDPGVAFISKPFTPEALALRLRELLAEPGNG